MLSRTGTVALPSRGPAADGFFWPPKGYTEGGHFAVATPRTEQDVDPGTIQPQAPAGTLRVAEFNVNRGTTLDALVQVMKQVNADVWLISESDLYGLNSELQPTAGEAGSPKRVVVGREFARALGGSSGYYYYTGSEFYERLTPKGTPKTAEAPLNDVTGAGRMGTSGTSILSRYPILEGSRVDVPMYASQGGHDWSTERPGFFSSTINGLLRNDDLQPQPRCGQRMALAATIAVPSSRGTTNIKFVSLHTENKSNANVRASQFDYVLYGSNTPLLARDQHELAILGGDLNTLSSGEGNAFRSHLAGQDVSLIDMSSAVSPSNETATDQFGRIDWLIEQPGTTKLPVASYAVGTSSGGSDHKPIWADLALP